MKFAVALAGLVVANASDTSPIDKVIQMISDLETKVIEEGKAAQKTYDEFAEWCEESSKNLMFEIKTGKSDVASLKATIEDEEANIAAQTGKIEELAGEIATDEADLKAATAIRTKESADFETKEADLVETIDILERAIGIIEKEMKGGAAMVQMSQAGGVVNALAAMVQAQSISMDDGKKLMAMVQEQNDDTGAPAGDVYSNQSGGIMDTMNDILGKAQDELDEARKEEQANLNNFELLKQSLTDEINFANKEKSEAEQSKAGSEESKATATGDLTVTSKDLNQDLNDLGSLHHDCMTKANDFEAETTDRGDELKALATAKKIIIEATGGASSQSYGFLQVSSKISTSADLAGFEAVRYVKNLAKKHNSVALAQLASRMSSTFRYSTGSKEDIFAKIKGLIADMINKLEEEAEADATEKAFCDKELAETNAKKDYKTAEIEKLTAKIDKQTSQAAILREEVAQLQAELSELAKSQAESDKIRAEEHAEWEVNSAEMEKGLNGIKLALKVLNEYYQKSGKAGGSSSGIIGLLEVCESDFSKALSEMNAAEDTAQHEYDASTKENDITKATKDQDVKYKTKEATGLEQSVSELSSDRSAVETELSAVNEYLRELEGRCIAKPESYSERKQRRADEIAGLKEAATILDNETAFIQKGRSLRLRAHRK